MEVAMQASSDPGAVLITGTSRGIGYALAQCFLADGHTVYGISRTLPSPSLRSSDRYVHVTADLSRRHDLGDLLREKLVDRYRVTHLQYVFLNAGQFSPSIAPLSRLPLAEIDQLMDVNVWANKVILDTLFGHGVGVDVCVASSSVAGVRARAGNGGYALSKATLNMLCQLYALEHPETYFAVLGLCNVDTALARRVLGLPLEGRFAEIEKLRQRGVQPGYVVAADARAQHMHHLLTHGLRDLLPSGQFAEIRSLLAQQPA
jgi:alcohol dehydrogenase